MRKFLLGLIIALTAITGLQANSDQTKIRIRLGSQVSVPSPITANEHPRLLFCENDYSGACLTRAALHSRIDGDAFLRARLDEVTTWADDRYGYVLKITGCTVANPTVCTTDISHGLSDGTFVYFAGSTGYTPNLNNGLTGYYVDSLSATTVALYSNVGLSSGINVTVAGTEGFISSSAGVGGQLFDELAMRFAFLAQMLTVGPLTGVTNTYTNAQYGERAIGAFLLVNQARATGSDACSGYSQTIGTYDHMLVFVYDWAFDWATTSQKTCMAQIFQNHDVTNGWNETNMWASQYQNQRIAVLVMAAALAGDGFEDAWADSIIAQFDEKACCDDESTVKSWSAHGGGTSSSIIEGTAYFSYSIVGHITLPEAWRTAYAIPKATFYNTTDYATGVYLPYFALATTQPWGVTNSGMIDNKQRATIRSWYATIWRENSNPDEIFRSSNEISAGVYGFLDPTAASYARWFQENRTIINSETGYSGNSIIGGHHWVSIMIMGDRSITAVEPPTSLNTMHLGDNLHAFREDIIDDDGYAILFYTPEYTTGAARGREASVGAGHFTIDRKGSQVITRGWTSHTGGDVTGFNYQCFPRQDRVRRDTFPTGSLLDDGGCRRGAEGIPTVYDSSDFSATGAKYLTSLRTSDGVPASGRRVDYVHADVTDAYPTSATTTTANPTVVSAAKIDFLVIRGASFGDPVRIARRDFATLTDPTTYEAVYFVNLAGEPTYNESSTTAGPSRANGVNAATTHCRTTMNGATQISSSNTVGSGSNYTNNGGMRVNILWPTSKTVIKAGGPNESGKMFYSSTHASGATDNSCEIVDHSGLRFHNVDDISKLGGGSTSGNNTGGSGGGHNLDYTVYGAADSGTYYTEIIRTDGVASGNFYLTWEVGDDGFTPRTVAALTSLTNVIGHVETSGTGRYIVVMSDSGSVSLTSGNFTAGVDNSTAYTLVITGMNPSSSRGVSCTNTTSFTQIDPTDTSSPFTFDSAGVGVFTFTSSSTSVVCTIT